MKEKLFNKICQVFRSRSLATQLTRTSILMVTIAVISVGMALIMIASRTQQDSAFRLQQQSAAQVSQLVSHYMQHAVDRLRFFIKTENLHMQTFKKQKIVLENFLIYSLPLFSQVSILDKDGHELHKISRFHTFLPEELTNQTQNPGFEVSIRGESYVGPVAFFADTGLLSVQVALPIHTPGHDIWGVIITDVNITHLWQQVSNIKVGQTGYAYLVDMNGRFVAYQKPAEVLQRYGENMNRMPPVSDFVRHGHDRVGNVQEYQGLVNETVIGVLIPIRGTRWAVVVEQPIREAYAGILEMKRYLLWMMLICILLAGGLGFLISRRLIHPIRTLTLAARRFGAGDLETEFGGIKRQDEVGVLSQAFQKMQQELILDITERKKSEEALRESESRFRELAENIRDVFWVFDWKKQKVLYINPSYDEVWGRSMQLLLDDSQEWENSIHPDDREKANASFRRIVETGGGENREYRIVRPDGTVRWISDQGFAVYDKDGSVLRIVGIAEDITKRRQEERERLEWERQVQHARKIESLGLMAGGIAHDFNNLLMVIQGNTDLAMDELPAKSAAHNYLQEVKMASDHATLLSRQMLDYSGKGRVVSDPILINQLVEETVHLMEASISKKVSVKLNSTADTPSFNGDVTQIRQIILCLFANASEAIGDQDGVITLSTGTRYCDRSYLDDVNDTLRATIKKPLPVGPYIYLDVADTGCGMEDRVVEKIFDPFFTTKFTGRGLGMSAVLGIVHSHKGTIKIFSEVGKGTTCRVLFPADQQPGQNSLPVMNEQGSEAESNLSGKILIVDDDETICNLATLMLERLDFSVLVAGNGQAALDILQKHMNEIACVLLDLTMPDMDGDETFIKMRQLKPGITVILCSGYSEQDTAERFAGMGLSGFLQKPFSMLDLKEKLTQVMKN